MEKDRLGISVVVCTYNGSNRLMPTLKAIINQTFPSHLFELIIIDNASQDNTFEYCKEVLSKLELPFSWRLIREEVSGLNYARLRGLREAKFDILLFCDDDNSINENYLQIGYDIYQANPLVGGLGGCGIPHFESSKPDWFDQYSHSFAVGPQWKTDGKILRYPSALYGAGTFLRRSPLLSFFDRGFETIMTDRKGTTLASGGDVEWCYLLQLAGYEIWYDHRLTFLHTMPESRMNWEYYLRLKQGIASGAAHLFPYVCLLRQRNMSLFAFGIRWMGEVVLATLLYWKHRSVLMLKDGPAKRGDDLAIVVLSAKMKSYWLNAASTFRHFLQLKTIL